MSAIAGLVQLDGAPADPRILGLMVGRIARRGPDGSGTWASGPAALGHLLLQVRPESIGERQPLASPDGALVITFDGRIDNREDLCEALGVAAPERAAADAALVLRAYAKWGADCPERLIGEFAFALWDGRRRELFCARDAFGARDFFYHHGGGRFAFSSEINAVLAAPGVPRRVDELALACQLGGLRGLGERTLYEGISSLRGAHSMVVRAGEGITQRRYWRLAMGPEIRLGSAAEYAEALRGLISAAVTACLRSAHPIAVTLSGGLDSSGVACMAARRLGADGRRLLAVSNVLPDDHQGDEWLREERSFIQSVCAQERNIDSRLVLGRRFPAIDFDDGPLDRLGQPAMDGFGYRTRELVAAAEAGGARVLLGGTGGDMAASLEGNGSLWELARKGRLPALLHLLRLQSRAQGISPLVLLRRGVIRPLVPSAVRRWRGRLRIAGSRGWDGTALRRSFAERMGLDEIRRELRIDDPPLDARLHIMELNERGWFASGNAWASGHGDSIEGAQPLMDRRIWEFAYRIPLEQFCADGIPRGLYRRAMAGVIPDAVLRRNAKGWFAPDYRARMLECRPAMRVFLDAHGAGDPIWDYVDRNAVVAALARLERPPVANQWDPTFQLVLGRGLRLAHFLSWLRKSG